MVVFIIASKLDKKSFTCRVLIKKELTARTSPSYKSLSPMCQELSLQLKLISFTLQTNCEVKIKLKGFL